MQDNPRLYTMLMIATTVVFAAQDGLSSHYLAESYNVITTIATFFSCVFVLAFSTNQQGGIRAIARTDQLLLQLGRGLLLAAQICVAIFSFTTVGLAFSCGICQLSADDFGAFSPYSKRSSWLAAVGLPC